VGLPGPVSLWLVHRGRMETDTHVLHYCCALAFHSIIKLLGLNRVITSCFCSLVHAPHVRDGQVCFENVVVQLYTAFLDSHTRRQGRLDNTYTTPPLDHRRVSSDSPDLIGRQPQLLFLLGTTSLFIFSCEFILNHQLPTRPPVIKRALRSQH
jgi:hypothetical protein